MGKKRLIVYAIATVIVLCIVFLPGFSELQKLREENDQLGKRIKLLEEYNNDLKAELMRMKEDPDYVEKKAREKLGIVKKGEIIYETNRENR